MLSYPDLVPGQAGVAIPLKRLAGYWVAYYWPFVGGENPILQGYRSVREGRIRHDVAFRPALTKLRESWEAIYGSSRPSDGYSLLSELGNPRTARLYDESIRGDFAAALGSMRAPLEQPIRYAGEGEYGVFERPRRASEYPGATLLPGTGLGERCVLVSPGVYRAFRELSLWIEALCIHEWSLFTERQDAGTDRGRVYRLLTSRIENRRPLTWERNQIDILMLEGRIFTCPWTKKRLSPGRYDVDHIIPVSVYPTNELWNLVPADPHFNRITKRAKMPSERSMLSAEPVLAETYDAYGTSCSMHGALSADLSLRFALPDEFSTHDLSRAVSTRTLAIAEARSVARFSCKV